jgi:hypothetical protein
VPQFNENEYLIYEFGASVSLSADGNTALVGAPGWGGWAGPKCGYVYVRNGNTWSYQATLAATDVELGLVTLSGDGNTALLTARENCCWPGIVCVFARSGSAWSQQAQLGATGPVSLSKDGNTALIGSLVFVRSGSAWSQQAGLAPSDGQPWDGFGASVSLSADGNRALIGAHGHDTPVGVDAGSAYLFVRSGSSWSEQAKLTAGDGAAGDYFGGSVSLSGDGTTALVGAPYDDTAAGTDAGSAYVFRVSSPGDAPTLFIQWSGDSVIISWSPATPGFELEATDDLASPAWSPVANGESPVEFFVTGPAQFYRLKQP